MYNKIIIVGNLTRDVELRHLPSSTALATLGVASNRRYTKQDGTKADETCFVDVKLFGRTAEVANQYLHKGSKVLIEGRLVYETWTDQSGQKRSKHSIVADNMQMLDGKSTNNGGYNNDGYDSTNYDEGYARNYGNNGSYTNYGTQQNQQNYQPAKQSNQNEQNIPSIDIDDDDIPF